jgi:hypothetical protein
MSEPDSRPADTADHARLPQLDSARIKLLFAMNWFDGPLSGLAEYEGRRVWFDFHHMDEEGLHFYYTLFPLTPEQNAAAVLWRRTHGRYVHGRWVGRDEARFDVNYRGPVLEGVEPLGWFMDGPNRDFYGIKVYGPNDPPPAPEPWRGAGPDPGPEE